MKNSPVRPMRRGMFIGSVLLLLLALGAGAWLTGRSRTSNPSIQPSASSPVQPNSPLHIQPSTTQPQPQTVPSPSSTIAQSPAVYRLRVENNQVRLAPTRIALAPGVSTEGALQQAINELLSNQQESELSSTIPAGTRLLSLQAAPSRIDVDLSPQQSSRKPRSRTYRMKTNRRKLRQHDTIKSD